LALGWSRRGSAGASWSVPRARARLDKPETFNFLGFTFKSLARARVGESGFVVTTCEACFDHKAANVIRAIFK
jgi:hypothetical protein